MHMQYYLCIWNVGGQSCTFTLFGENEFKN